MQQQQTFWREMQEQAKQLGVKETAFRQWKRQNRVPAKYHLEIIDACEGRVSREELRSPKRECWIPGHVFAGE